MVLLFLLLFDIPPKFDLDVRPKVVASYTVGQSYVKISGEPKQVIRVIDSYFDKQGLKRRKFGYIRTLYEYYVAEAYDRGRVILYCGTTPEKLLIVECLNE